MRQLPSGLASLVITLLLSVGLILAVAAFGVYMAKTREAAIEADRVEWNEWVRDCRNRTTNYCGGYYGQGERQ